MEGKVILLISPEKWGNNHVSKHHYAHYLSLKNKVYFLNPPCGFKKLPFGNLIIGSKEVSENLIVVDYKNLLPKLNLLKEGMQAKVYGKMAQKIQRELAIENFDLVWSFDPYRFFDAGFWKTKKSIYHSVDVHFNQCFEERLASTSDLVLLSSEILLQKLADTNKNIHVNGHGTDLISFEKESESPINLPGTNTIKAGLVGNFNNNVDYTLIEQIAQRNTKIDFIFIGPYASNNLGNDVQNVGQKVQELSLLENVFFIGEVPSKSIIHYLKKFDINLVLYREDRRDIIINPHKMMGYFYAGKVTISSYFNEYKNASEALLIMLHTNKEIPDKINEVANELSLHNSQERSLERRNFALVNSYENKINQIKTWLG